MKELKLIIVSVLCFGVFLSTQSLRGAEVPQRGGRLVFGMRQDIHSLNPHFHTRSQDKYVRELIYEQLLDADKDNKLAPALAESWTVSSDGKTYVFKLRPGVKFHNGKELTAEDVKWSAEYAMDRENVGTGRSFLRSVKAVNVKDGLTVEFTLKEPDAVFLAKMATIRSFPVTPQGAVPPAKEKVLKFPPGTGPFVFSEWKAGSEIVLERNRDYWQKGLPYLDGLVLKVVLDPSVRFAALRAGDLDMIERTPLPFVSKIAKGEFPELGTTPAKYADFYRFVFNVQQAPFTNVKVRQAIRYALNKRDFIEGAFWGFGVPAEQRDPKESPWYVKLPEIEPDRVKARALLKEAGFDPNFEVELLAERGEEELYQVIQAQLAAAGIKARIKVLEYGAYRRLQRSGEFMINLGGADTPPDPGLVYPAHFGCHKAAVKAKQRQSNRSGYCNEEVDRLLEQAAKITDPKKRYDLYAKVVRTIDEEVPEIPLAFVPRVFTYGKKVKGFSTDFDGRFHMVNGGFSRIWIEK